MSGKTFAKQLELLNADLKNISPNDPLKKEKCDRLAQQYNAYVHKNLMVQILALHEHMIRLFAPDAE